MLSRREGQQGGQGAHRVVRGEASQPRGQGGITWGLLCLRDPSRSFTWKDLGFYSESSGNPGGLWAEEQPGLTRAWKKLLK